MTPTDLDRKAEELAGPHAAMCKKGETCQCSHRERLAIIRATLGEMQEEISAHIISSQARIERVKADLRRERRTQPRQDLIERAEAAEAKCAELENALHDLIEATKTGAAMVGAAAAMLRKR